MGKNAKYGVDYPKKNAKYPSHRVKNDPEIVKPIVTVDNEVVPGAKFYAETNWILPGAKKNIKLCESHTPKVEEMIGFFGFNYENIQDLGAEIEITIDNEKNLVDRSFCAYIPPGVQMGPVIVKNVTRPIFWVSSGRAPKYE